jgi:hypothetical protein
MTNVPKERLTDDSIKVRQVTHHQFSFVAGSGTAAGRFTLQLVLDQGASEEVISITAEDAEVVQHLLQANSNVHYDIPRRLLMFGTRAVGH